MTELLSDVPSILPSLGPVSFGAAAMNSDMPSLAPSLLSISDVPSVTFDDSSRSITTTISDYPSTLPTPSPITFIDFDPSNSFLCEDYLPGGYNESFKVCYVPSSAAISSISSIYGNDTMLPAASQVYWYNYSIYNPADVQQSYVITVERSGEVLEGGSGTDLTECQYVAIAGMECTSCTYCGNETMSADCTNMKYGRNVTCEPLAPLFFPLSSEAA